MKKLLTLVLAALCFVACTQNEVEELTANRVALPETLTVGFEGGDTRIELNEALKTVWSKGDEVSVFYLSDANQKWQYQGETGERLGTLKCVDRGVAEEKMQRVVVAYPYNAQYVVNTDTHNLYASLPAVQIYKEGSYGADGNIMVAQSEFTQFSLKSVVGWLRVELTGEGESVKSITLRGNAGEQVAGLIYVDTATAEATLASEIGEASDEEQVGGVGGGLEFDDTVFTEVTLDCGSGVELGSEATAFYIALLPQTFAEGMTIEVNCAGYKPMTLSTESSITIERNHIKPMAAVEHDADSEPTTTASQLCYTATAKVEPKSSAFNVVIVSNEWDEATGEGVITFDGELTTIGDYAFRGCDSLTSVTMPDSVTTIGSLAFYYCSSLTSVTIPNSVTTIGEAAFSECCLTSVTIPDSVTTIGEGAFSYCSSLTRVIIGNSVTTIGINAFAFCESLTSVTIPDSVTTIGDVAFASCSSLTSVTIPDSVTTIGQQAFYYCSSLTSVYCKATTPPTLEGSYVFYSNAAGRKIYVPAESVEAYKAAEGWSEYAADIVGYNIETGEEVAISNKLFYTATALVEPYDASAFNAAIVSNEWNEATCEGVITFDGELTMIGDYAFRGCDSLTSVTMPDSVTTIGEYAFSYCDSLTSVTIPDSVTTIGYCAFYDCDNLTSVTIGDSVTTIGNNAFNKCTSLTSVTIGDSVTTIGDFAFCYCESLTSITIPDSVTTIGDRAFRYCSSLTSVTIPDSVTTIGNYAFQFCSSLTSVTIPDSVTTIGNYAFFDCPTSVYCKATTPPSLGDYVFKYWDESAQEYINIGCAIYVPAESVKAYKAATNWSEYASYIVGYDFETGVVVE